MFFVSVHLSVVNGEPVTTELKASASDAHKGVLSRHRSGFSSEDNNNNPRQQDIVIRRVSTSKLNMDHFVSHVHRRH